MKTLLQSILSGLAVVGLVVVARAQLAPAVQEKVDAEIAAAQALAADPVIVEAVRGYNTAPPGEARAMTQETWKRRTLLDPFVRGLSRNPASLALMGAKSAFVTEAFVSGGDGGKVAFLAKPSHWSHRGNAKHDRPMRGDLWQGMVETDESTGLHQIQVAVPVLDAGVPIGSLVVGLSLSKMGD